MIALISCDSCNNNLNLFSFTNSDSIKILSQYSVSEGVILRFPQNADRPKASFKAISNLWIKSLFDCADCASWTFAPILVPDLSSCLDKVLDASDCFERKLQALIILIAKFSVLSVIGILVKLIQNYNLSIEQFALNQENILFLS